MGIPAYKDSIKMKNDLTFTVNSNFGTVTNSDFRYIRNGKVMDVTAYFQSGTTIAAEGYIQLPAGILIDDANLNTGSNRTLLGYLYELPVGTASITPFALFYDGSTNDRIYFAKQGSSSVFVKGTAGNISGNNEGVIMKFSFPVKNW